MNFTPGSDVTSYTVVTVHLQVCKSILIHITFQHCILYLFHYKTNKMYSYCSFPLLVALVEACNQPMGVQLVNSHLTNKANDSNDLVELALQIQMVRLFRFI